MKKSIVLAVSCLFISAALFAERLPAPTAFNTYDGIAPGGRPLAMGNAFTAVGDDPATVFFNPAGLSRIKDNMVGITYEATRQSTLTNEEIFAPETLKNRNLNFLGLISSKGAFSWRPVADTTSRTVNGADWQNDEIKVNAYTLSAAHEGSPEMNTGLNLTYLSGSIAQARVVNNVPYTNISDGYGVAADLGFLYTRGDVFSLGVAFKNLAGFMWWQDFEADQLPFTVRAGASFRIPNFFTFATDWEKIYYRKPTDAKGESVHFGLEQNLGPYLQVRAGIYGSDLNDRETTHLTAGLGYLKSGYSLSLSGEKYRLDLTDVYRYVLGLNIPI